MQLNARARSHTGLEAWFDPSVGTSGNTLRESLQEQDELRRLLAGKAISMPGSNAAVNLFGDEINVMANPPAMTASSVPQNGAASHKTSLGNFTAALAHKLTRRKSQGAKDSSPEPMNDDSAFDNSPGALGGDDNDDKDNKKRKRRTFAELNRDIQCPVAECARLYASAHSLQQHIRIKHVDLYLAQKEQRGKKQPQQSSPTNASDAMHYGDWNMQSPVESSEPHAPAAVPKKKGSIGSFFEHDVLSRFGFMKRSNTVSPSNATPPAQPSPMNMTSFDQQSSFSVEGRNKQRPSSAINLSPSFIPTTDSILEELFKT